ncbi:YciI family protein [Nocardia inohanensis]|uniref:YciI family protein n=1 Tax=Nocardia inohanensis TaxID=209246 RepID=UPI000832B8C0|nr:YciI family protein [Nocardia inohanensis]
MKNPQADGKQTVIDGPYTEAREIVGGYLMLQTRSDDEAAEWARRFLRVHGPKWDIEVEMRRPDHQE